MAKDAKEVKSDPGELPRASGILERSERPKTEFAKALTKLASDTAYREKVTSDPGLITQEFKLSLKDLQALRQVAILSGADVSAVNKYRAAEVAARTGGISAVDVDVSCCSCCCCCCGETGVADEVSINFGTLRDSLAYERAS